MKDSQGTYTNSLKIANKFNVFFVNVGPSLAKTFSPNTNNHKQYLTGSYNSIIFLSPISPSEIITTINLLKNSKSEGIDGISISVIKSCADILALPLYYIFNASISHGIFPDSLKVAKIIPIFKNDDCSNFSNYRPISILSCFSKILEKLVYKRFLAYLEKYDILNYHQYGFQKNHSTFMPITELIDNIYSSFEIKRFTIGIFIDLKKAFDNVNHSILLDKLAFCGFRGNALNWIKSYFENRYQSVQINEIKSSSKPIKCGVPKAPSLDHYCF